MRAPSGSIVAPFPVIAHRKGDVASGTFLSPLAMTLKCTTSPVRAFAVFGSTWEEATGALRERYEGLVDRVGVYGTDAGDAEQIARYWFSSSSSGGTSRS